MLNRLLPKNKKQRGSAIISALFLMSIVAMLAVTMLTRQNVQIRRTEIIFQEERLLAQAAWVEIWAMEQLRVVIQDLTEEEDYIALDQEWAKPLDEFQQEGIWVSGEIIDLQGQFNINNLLADIDESVSAEAVAEEAANAENATETNLEENTSPLALEEEEEKDPFDKETPFTTAWMFARLLNHVGNESLTNAQGVTESIMHWIEPEVTEWDNEYFDMQPPYQPAHQPLQSLSELRQIRYVNNEMLTALQPYITAYVSTDVQQETQSSPPPETEQGAEGGTASNNNELFPLNVNTTTAPLLAAVLSIETAKANNVIDARPFYTEDELQEELNVLNLSAESGPAQSMLSVTSHYFLVKAVARDDRRAIVQYSILKRNSDGNLAVIRRVQGEM